MKTNRFAVVQESAAGKLQALKLWDRVAGTIADKFDVTSQALQDGTAKAKMEELMGMAAWLNLRAA